MYHPGIPGQIITVPASAVDHYRKRGWKLYRPGTAPEADDAPALLAAPTPAKAPARRRSTKKEAS